MKYVVANGKSLVCGGVIKSAGMEVVEKDFPSKESFDRHLKAEAIVELTEFVEVDKTVQVVDLKPEVKEEEPAPVKKGKGSKKK